MVCQVKYCKGIHLLFIQTTKAFLFCFFQNLGRIAEWFQTLAVELNVSAFKVNLRTVIEGIHLKVFHFQSYSIVSSFLEQLAQYFPPSKPLLTAQ